MKNMKLAVKLALGFGILMAVALSLGGLAVWEMTQVGLSVNRLRHEEVPMAKAAMAARGALNITQWEVLPYVSTGQDNFRRRAADRVAETYSHLQDALALAEEHPGLSGMKKNILKANDKTKELESLIAEAAARHKEIRAICASQDGSAEQFTANCSMLLDYQNKLLEALTGEAAAGTNLIAKTAEIKERFRKIALISEVIDQGIAIRVANWKSQALRDPAVSAATIRDFDSIDAKIEELEQIVRQPINREQLALVRRAAGEYRKAMGELTDALTAREETNAKLVAAAGEAIDAATASATPCMERVVSTATQSSENLIRASKIMMAGLVFATSLCVLIAVSLTVGITRPVLKGVRFANEMAKGDFSQRLDIDQGDEIGLLAQALNTVAGNLRTQITEIREAANILVSSASEISASVTQVTSGARETATAVTQTTATVEEVKQSSLLTSQKAKGVAENAQHGLQTVLVGRKATELAVEGMTRISGQMASIADTIEKLGEQSQTIGEITATVDDIAEQSNLLAVNAAVEAAKAGEHGKGFAVVAQEIKSLAEQSKQATKQVRGILSEIQKATGAAVMATDLGGKAVEQGTKESMSANESIQALSLGFTEAAQAAGQIAASTQEQLMGMDQVALAMGSIHEASQQNVASMKQLEAAAQTLKEVGHRFTELIGRNKV